MSPLSRRQPDLANAPVRPDPVPRMPAGSAVTFEHVLHIAAPPRRVLAAFFDPQALCVWWQTTRSITTPRSLGVYALEWAPTVLRDEVLGPLGGIFHGTVVDYSADREFFVAEAYWLPPEGDPIGPMALEVQCAPEGNGTRLSVRQSGYEPGLRWSRYYAVITQGWTGALTALKTYLEA